MEVKFRTLDFVTPSGVNFTIREQNGEDEDILSNPLDSRNLMNLTKFIAAIVVKTDCTPSGKLSVEDALNLPLLDRYCILLKSRIFSLGDEIEIQYTWPGTKEAVSYEDLVSNFVFEDYSNIPTEEEMNEKPFACPFYPNRDNLKDMRIELKSGKVIMFDCMTGKGEQYLLSLPEDKKTRNSELLARNLRLEVEGNPEKVTNFSCFSVRDMAEIRKAVAAYDPSFQGLTELEDPKTGDKIMFPIMASPSFFYLTEA